MKKEAKKAIAHRACLWLLSTGFNYASLAKRLNRTPASVRQYVGMTVAPSDDVLAAMLALVREHMRNLAMITNQLCRPDQFSQDEHERAACYAMLDRVAPAVKDLHQSLEMVGMVQAEAATVAAEMREFRERTGRDLFSAMPDSARWCERTVPED